MKSKFKTLRSALFFIAPVALILAGLAWFILHPKWQNTGFVSHGTQERLDAALNQGALTSESCKSCHAQIHEDWKPSHHALANRALHPELDTLPFKPDRELLAGKVRSIFNLEGGPRIHTEAKPGESEIFAPDMVLAYDPLIQYLIPFPGGRWQATEAAWDVHGHEWFDVYGKEGRIPGEWGSWSGRGMNWNSNCASCHMTNFQKGYDIAADTYHSTWDEMGISCTQCHVVTSAHFTDPKAPLKPARTDKAALQETCMSCHSRREELTLNFKPSDKYHDHYRLALPDQPGLYHPDGQVLDEVFVSGSFLMSRMGGFQHVSCLDCHDPHTTRTKLPIENNALCMSCHTPPGVKHAIPIMPAEHSHHPEGSTGNRCVECHMTFTTYMERDPRRDHGFHTPDPLLTKELNIPNACNKCHTDKSVDWAIEWTDRWYGDKMETRQRKRARIVARAQAVDPEVAPDLLALLAAEDVPAWRATYAGFLAAYPAQPGVREALRELLKDQDPLVRAAAVAALARFDGEQETLKKSLADPSRNVRLNAAWPLNRTDGLDAESKRELVEYLKIGSDQPSGAARQAQAAFFGQRYADAYGWLDRAIQWDPLSAPLYRDLAVMKNSQGDTAGALEAAIRGNADALPNAELQMTEALLHGETGDQDGAESALRKAVNIDPNFARAWYNLGLLLSSRGEWDESIEALKKAEALEPDNADAPYARATIHFKRKEPRAGAEALGAALQADPNHGPARALLKQMSPQSIMRNPAP